MILAAQIVVLDVMAEQSGHQCACRDDVLRVSRALS